MTDHEAALREALAVFLVAKERLEQARRVHDAAAADLAALLVPPADLAADLAHALDVDLDRYQP